MAINSGPEWVSKFPTSRSIDDLAPPFGLKVQRFAHAMEEARMHYTISATLRPKQRAQLMHWAWYIAEENFPPAQVPPIPGVDIIWNHPGYKAAAAAMVREYGIAYEPALASRHIDGLAIDWTITYTGTPSIRKPDGSRGTILELAHLWHIGALYGVHKLVSDPPHWSSDGH